VNVKTGTAILIAGIPASNMTLYHRIRFSVGDPSAWIGFEDGTSLLLVRDIEMERARRHARADAVACPADFAPAGGLSGNRELATAQALAECLVQHEVREVIGDRSLSLVYIEHLAARSIKVSCDYDLGIAERRAKDQEERAALAEAQAFTESAMRVACETIASAEAAGNGVLHVGGEPLTSERVRTLIDLDLLERGCAGSPSIVAGGAQGGDCHELGSGLLRTGEPVIVDIFPRNTATLYHGDCTRTVVHGEIPPEVARMHATVVKAKAAGHSATRAGVTGQTVHEATIEVIRAAGYGVGLPGPDAPLDSCSMVHGTGHGIGLEVHEAPLLDFGGPELVEGDAITIEPGLYSKAIGGVRIEDMVIVTEAGCETLNALPEGLCWE
jgi:Xaa-Pro aminopeptidase